MKEGAFYGVAYQNNIQTPNIAPSVDSIEQQFLHAVDDGFYEIVKRILDRNIINKETIYTAFKAVAGAAVKEAKINTTKKKEKKEEKEEPQSYELTLNILLDKMDSADVDFVKKVQSNINKDSIIYFNIDLTCKMWEERVKRDACCCFRLF